MLPSKEQIVRSPLIPICGEFITSGGYPLWLLFKKRSVWLKWRCLQSHKEPKQPSCFHVSNKIFLVLEKGKPACLTTLWCQEWNLHVNIASIYLGFRINRYFICNMFNHGVLYSITSIFVVSECGNTHMPLCHLQSFPCINVYIHKYQEN